MAETRVIHDDIQPAKCIEGGLDGGACGGGIGDIEGDGTYVVPKALDQIRQLARIARRRDHALASLQRRFDNLAPETARATGYQPDLRHDLLLEKLMSM